MCSITRHFNIFLNNIKKKYILLFIKSFYEYGCKNMNIYKYTAIILFIFQFHFILCLSLFIFVSIMFKKSMVTESIPQSTLLSQSINICFRFSLFRLLSEVFLSYLDATHQSFLHCCWVPTVVIRLFVVNVHRCYSVRLSLFFVSINHTLFQFLISII